MIMGNQKCINISLAQDKQCHNKIVLIIALNLFS